MRNIFLLLFATIGLLSAQQKTSLRIAPVGNLEFSAPSEDYFTTLTRLEAPYPGDGSYRGWLLQQKLELEHTFPRKDDQAPVHKTTTVSPPFINLNYQANTSFQGVPNDNSMAISNDGFVISAINSSINIFQYNILQTSKSLNSIATPLGIADTKYDPKVVYDPVADRFILVFLAGFDDAHTHIIAAFSQTNDPRGSWNLYDIPGNPRNNGTWSDYPIIAISEGELFITVNSILTDSSWQAGFVESLCWQINKTDGYTGDTLSTHLWYDTKLAGKSIRCLFPVPDADVPTGRGIWLLSNRNFSAQNDSIIILHINDTINAPGLSMSIQVAQSDRMYGMPPTALQPSGHTLDTNDGRVLGAFKLGADVIQFVSNTIDTLSGGAGIYHGIIQNLSSTPSISGHIIRDSIDLGYPNIAWTGSVSGDMDAIITFNHSANDVLPGESAVYFDGTGNYSDRLVCKAGVAVINVLTGSYERWGDYSGIQRRYNVPGEVWMTGMYGKGSGNPGTWVVQLTKPGLVGMPENVRNGLEMQVFPNPTTSASNVTFYNPSENTGQISIIDPQGKVVAILFEGAMRRGKHELQFSLEPLPAGTYLLKIQCGGDLLSSKQLVVTH